MRRKSCNSRSLDHDWDEDPDAPGMDRCLRCGASRVSPGDEAADEAEQKTETGEEG